MAMTSLRAIKKKIFIPPKTLYEAIKSGHKRLNYTEKFVSKMISIHDIYTWLK